MRTSACTRRPTAKPSMPAAWRFPPARPSRDDQPGVLAVPTPVVAFGFKYATDAATAAQALGGLLAGVTVVVLLRCSVQRRWCGIMPRRCLKWAMAW